MTESVVSNTRRASQVLHLADPSNLMLMLSRETSDRAILAHKPVYTTGQAPISGAIPTLDRNSQQAKTQGRNYGLSVDLGGITATALTKGELSNHVTCMAKGPEIYPMRTD